MNGRQRQRPPDGLPKAIDIYVAAERAAWAQKLGVSEQRLMEVVREVGVELDAIRLYLGQAMGR